MTLHQPPVIAAIAVDELAEVKAAIAVLQIKEKALVTALKATGMERIVSLSERETVDVKAMPAELKAPYLRLTLVETLKLTARKTS